MTFSLVKEKGVILLKPPAGTQEMWLYFNFFYMTLGARFKEETLNTNSFKENLARICLRKLSA